MLEEEEGALSRGTTCQEAAEEEEECRHSRSRCSSEQQKKFPKNVRLVTRLVFTTSYGHRFTTSPATNRTLAKATFLRSYYPRQKDAKSL